MLRRFVRKVRRFKEQKIKEGRDAYVILDGCIAVYDSGKYYIRCPCKENGDLIHVGHRDRRSKVDRNNSSSKPRLNFDWKLLTTTCKVDVPWSRSTWLK
jgi:hypothetical protein